MTTDQTQALTRQSPTAISSASRLAERTLAERADRLANKSLAERISMRLSTDGLVGEREQAARVAAFIAELQITLEAGPPGAWFPLNFRRGAVTIPFEDRQLRLERGAGDIESAIRYMALAHAVGAPARAERVRAHEFLGEEGFAYLVSVIGLRESKIWGGEPDG